MRVSPLDLEGYALQLLRQLRQFWREGHLCLGGNKTPWGPRWGKLVVCNALGGIEKPEGMPGEKKQQGSFWQRKKS